MINVALFAVAVALYLGATFSYLAAWLGGSRRSRGYASWFLLGAVVVHAAGMGTRWLESGYPPVSNAFESFSFYGWALAAAYLILERKVGHPSLGVFVTPIALVAIVVASVLPKGIKPLIPMLQSNWLGIHVTISFLAYVVFTLAFATAVALLRLDHTLKQGKSPRVGSLPSLLTLDNLGWRMALIGAYLMTGSLITGSIWAERAWGVPWVWQPQQVSALLTWLVYVAYLWTRYQLNWRGRRSAWLLVAGFVAMLITFVGVDLILPGGLHDFIFGGTMDRGSARWS